MARQAAMMQAKMKGGPPQKKGIMIKKDVNFFKTRLSSQESSGLRRKLVSTLEHSSLKSKKPRETKKNNGF
jgi:hypothetical protein